MATGGAKEPLLGRGLERSARLSTDSHSYLASEQKMPWQFSSRIACSRDGSWLVWDGEEFSSTRRHWLCIWDRVEDIQHRVTVTDHILDLKISPDGSTLAITNVNQVVLYALQRFQPIGHPSASFAPTSPSSNVVSRIAFSPDSAAIAAGTYDGQICIFSIESGIPTHWPFCNSAGVSALAWKDNAHLFVGYRDGSVVYLDLDEVLTSWLPRQTEGPINDLLISSTGILLAACGDDDSNGSNVDMPMAKSAIHSWDLRTEQPLEPRTEHKAVVNTLCLREGRCEFFSGSGHGHPYWNKEKAIFRWNDRSSYPSQRLTHLGSEIVDLCYVESENTLYSMGYDAWLQEWCFRDREDFSHRWHERDIDLVTFSPCGKYFATAACYDDPIIGRVLDGRKVSRLSGHEQFFFAIAFSHDGRMALTAPSEPDKTNRDVYPVRLWDVETGHCLATLPHARGVMWLAVSEDDRFIVTGTGDFNFIGRHIQTVYLWDSRSLRLVDQCGGRAMSNADEVSETEIRSLLAEHRVSLRQAPPVLWRAERERECATRVSRWSDPRDRHAPAMTWLPTIPALAERPYAWHPTEPILAVATGPFLQLFRMEETEDCIAT